MIASLLGRFKTPWTVTETLQSYSYRRMIRSDLLDHAYISRLFRIWIRKDYPRRKSAEANPPTDTRRDGISSRSQLPTHTYLFKAWSDPISLFGTIA